MKEIIGNNLLNTEGKVVLDFQADWCMPCKMITLLLEDLEKEFDEIKFFKINVETNQTLTYNYSVGSVPTIIVLEDGKPFSRLVGKKDKDSIRNAIKNPTN